MHRIVRMVAATVAALAMHAHAVVLPSPDPDWHLVVASAEAATEIVYGNGLLAYAIGTTVYARNAATGSLVGSYATGDPIVSPPVITRLQDGKVYIFVATTGGKLYKVDVAAAMTIAKTAGVSQITSLRRGADAGCAVKDSLTASPVVQRALDSNAAYTLGIDLVIVPTHHGCSSRTTNMVHAFDAADIAQPPVWVFNEFGDYAMDFSNGCLLELERNVVYCIAALQSGTYQNTLWNIETQTGNLLWAVNAASLQTQPALSPPIPGGGTHLYVADMQGLLHAIDPLTGAEHWTMSVSAASGIRAIANPVIASGDYAGQIMVTTSFGELLFVYDGGAVPGSGEVVWTAKLAMTKFLGKAAFSPGAGRIFVGSDVGVMFQISPVNGSLEGYVAVDGQPPYPPSSYNGASVLVYSPDATTRLLQARIGPGMAIMQYIPPERAAVTSASHFTTPVATAATFTVTATGIPVPVLALTGALPAGMAFTAASGELSGTPGFGTVGDYPLQVRAANGVDPDAVQNLVLTVAPACILDVDGNQAVDAMTDGLILLRAMFGLTGTAVTDGAVAENATRKTWDKIRPVMLSNALDVDGNHATDALTDGLLILRAMLGLTGNAVTAGAIGPGATRADWDGVRGYLNGSCGTHFLP